MNLMIEHYIKLIKSHRRNYEAFGVPCEDSEFLLSDDVLRQKTEEELKIIHDRITTASFDELKTKFRLQQFKKSKVEFAKLETAYADIVESEEKLKKIQLIDIVKPRIDNIDQMIATNNKLFESFKQSKPFLNSSFDGAVPFTPTECIGLLAFTGDGKTSAAANIAWSVVKNKGRVLFISNEEDELQLFNRIACIAKLEKELSYDWYYVNRGKFTKDQQAYLNNFLKQMKTEGLINIIDQRYDGGTDFTRKIENITSILDKLVEKPGLYDCVLIDYYQNIDSSMKDRRLNKYEVQDKFASIIEMYKQTIGCPIVIMMQRKDKPSKEKDWDERIKGSKSMAQPCSMVMELVKRKETNTTDWIIHKSRYGDQDRGKIVTGFQYGKISELNDEFFAWSAVQIRQRKEREEYLEKLKKLEKQTKGEDND